MRQLNQNLKYLLYSYFSVAVIVILLKLEKYFERVSWFNRLEIFGSSFLPTLLLMNFIVILIFLIKKNASTISMGVIISLIDFLTFLFSDFKL